MNETTLEAQQKIFSQLLNETEDQAVNALVNQHKGNAALTQQLALDASRLIATSQDRLAMQAGDGFFKRFASKFSGKNSENQLQNQVDMLQMQRFAWHYLKQLQQQNLINAQSIAVIRNNLGTMNDYIIETRDFLEQAVDKISHRLVNVENNTSFNNWSLHIEANKRRFKSIPDNLLVLHLTYDFTRCHRNVVLTSRDINYLVVTLEKLGINCDQDVHLLDFIIELIEQIKITGIERYREMIELTFDDHVVDFYFIKNNISGIGFNALYFLSEEYDKVISLTADSNFCRSDQDRENIISKFFGNEFYGLSTTYSIRDLIGEVIGGGALAIDIYRNVNGLNVIPEKIEETEQPEIITLTSSLPDIKFHTFLDNTDDDEVRRNYLRLFSLCIENSAALNKLGQEFLTLLAEKFSYPKLCDEIFDLANSPHKTHENLLLMQTLLTDDDKIYTWLIDAFFLLTLCQIKIENPQMLRILGRLKPTKIKENLPFLLVLINEIDEAKVLEAAAKLASQTQGWKNIIRYRELRFDHYYSEAENKINSASIAACTLSLDLTTLSLKASKYSCFIGTWEGDSFLGKLGSAVGSSAYKMGRSSCLNDLNDLRKNARNFISDNYSTLNLTSSMIRSFNMQTIEFNDKISYSEYDLDNSVTNEQWYDQFCHFVRQIETTLNSFSTACSDTKQQLNYFKIGEFEKSVVETQEQDRVESRLKQQQEQRAKQSAVIWHNGREHRLSIEWKDLKKPPCEPEKIRHIKTDGNVWLLVDNDGDLYRSENREDWQLVQPKASKNSLLVHKLDIVNGVWILVTDYKEGFYYSSDALIWQQSCFPELPSPYDFSQTDDIIHFNGQWLWRFTERTEYSYTEEGIIFDSTKTSTYDKTLIYWTDRLDAQWQRWETTPRHPEGVVVESICSLPGTECLLEFCKYDRFYIMYKKKNDDVSFVRYHQPGKDWRSCTWGSDKKYSSKYIITRMDDEFICFYSDQLLTSEKGYEWKLHPKKIYVRDCFHLDNFSLFPSQHNDQVIYLSQDAKAFEELILDDGSWKYFCANNQGALSVYAPNKHETFLRSGHFIYQPKH